MNVFWGGSKERKRGGRNEGGRERDRERGMKGEREREREIQFRLSINSIIMNFSCLESFMYIQNYQTLLHTKNRFIFLVSSVTITPG